MTASDSRGVRPCLNGERPSEVVGEHFTSFIYVTFRSIVFLRSAILGHQMFDSRREICCQLRGSLDFAAARRVLTHIFTSPAVSPSLRGRRSFVDNIKTYTCERNMDRMITNADAARKCIRSNHIGLIREYSLFYGFQSRLRNPRASGGEPFTGIIGWGRKTFDSPAFHRISRECH